MALLLVRRQSTAKYVDECDVGEKAERSEKNSKRFPLFCWHISQFHRQFATQANYVVHVAFQSVTLHTDVGDIKIEVYCEDTPKAAENFLALCASDYYNGCVFIRNIKGFMVQTGDPTNTGKACWICSIFLYFNRYIDKCYRAESRFGAKSSRTNSMTI